MCVKGKEMIKTLLYLRILNYIKSKFCIIKGMEVARKTFNISVFLILSCHFKYSDNGRSPP